MTLRRNQIHADPLMHGHYSHSLMLNSSSTLFCLRIFFIQQSSCLTLYSPLIFCWRLPLPSCSVIMGLKEKHTEDSWRAIWNKAEALCATVGVAKPAQLQQEKRQAQKPHNLQDYIAPVQIERHWPTIVNEMTQQKQVQFSWARQPSTPKMLHSLQRKAFSPWHSCMGLKRTTCWPRCTKCNGSWKETKNKVKQSAAHWNELLSIPP